MKLDSNHPVQGGQFVSSRLLSSSTGVFADLKLVAESGDALRYPMSLYHHNYFDESLIPAEHHVFSRFAIPFPGWNIMS